MSKKDILKKTFKDTIPVFTGYFVLGIAFGIIMKTKGFGALWSLAMSTVIYAGSMQYLAVDMMTAGTPLITVALTTLMVNARHIFYGISMVDKYKNTGKAKPYLIYALTDETYSLVCTESDMTQEERNFYYLAVSALNAFYWAGSCVLGSLVGSFITFNTEGVDFALTALFVTVFVEQWLSSKDHRPALTGLGASLVCLLIFGKDTFLIPSMLLITLVLSLMRGRKGVKA